MVILYTELDASCVLFILSLSFLTSGGISNALFVVSGVLILFLSRNVIKEYSFATSWSESTKVNVDLGAVVISTYISTTPGTPRIVAPPLPKILPYQSGFKFELIS